MMAHERYGKNAQKLFDTLNASGALKDFRHAMMARAEMISRDMLAANEDNVLHALRGQLSICLELADGALMALEAAEEKAKSDAVKGLPQSLQ